MTWCALGVSGWWLWGRRGGGVFLVKGLESRNFWWDTPMSMSVSPFVLNCCIHIFLFWFVFITFLFILYFYVHFFTFTFMSMFRPKGGGEWWAVFVGGDCQPAGRPSPLLPPSVSSLPGAAGGHQGHGHTGDAHRVRKPGAGPCLKGWRVRPARCHLGPNRRDPDPSPPPIHLHQFTYAR